MRKLYSWSRFAGRALGAAAELPLRPSKIVFVVTKRCYSKCVYCDIWKAKDKPGGLDGELSLEEVRKVASANPFLQWIDFTGGEPTDHPHFEAVVESFSEACPDLLLVHFPTNGINTRRITDVVTRLKASLRAQLVVTVSIDGPPELNDRLRGIRNDFSHAIDSFVAARRLLGPGRVFVGMTLHGFSGTVGMTTETLMRSTFDAIGAALRERGEVPIGWQDFHLNIPHISQHYYDNGQATTPGDGFGGPKHRSEVAAALQAAAQMHKAGGFSGMRAVERIYRREALRYLEGGRTRIPCSALLQTAYLSEKGQVFPCTIWDKPLGNVRDTGYALMPLIERARAEGLRQQVKEARCPNCWTPCEAYPAILSSPFRSLRTFVGL